MIQRVQSGQRLRVPARVYNAVADVVEDFERRRLQQPADPPARREVIYVRNDSGADRSRFDVLGLDAPVILPADNPDHFAVQIALSGVLPTATHVGGCWAVLLEPLVQGALGRACLAGACVARVKRNTPTDRYCDVVAGSVRLQSSASGPAQLLWLEPVTLGADGWTILRLGAAGGGDPRFLAKITGYAALAANRWKYAWEEVTLSGDDDATLPGGRSGSTSAGYAINLIEINNDGISTEGNGVNVSALPGTFALQPAPVNVIVSLWFVGSKPVFQYENAVDGAC